MPAKGSLNHTVGMASKDAQIEWRGRIASLEGIATTVPSKGPVADILAQLERGVRSGFSYSGANSLQQLQSSAQFIKQTVSGQAESTTHILRQ